VKIFQRNFPTAKTINSLISWKLLNAPDVGFFFDISSVSQNLFFIPLELLKLHTKAIISKSRTAEKFPSIFE
jgi:hypothetical protein